MNTTLDPRIMRLSYSGRTTLHRCPRKFQLEKLAKPERIAGGTSVTFAFGHVVGAGIQSVLMNKPWNQVIMDMVAMWDIEDLYEEDTKSNKSFFSAVFAVQSFQSLRATMLADYELAFFQGKPAVELSFKISILEDFTYRGYVDVVLKNIKTGRYIVLEIKTTNAKYVSDAMYKNSSQALGYSIILDTIAPGNSEYEVWYLVYLTVQQKFEVLPFKKHYSDRAFWIKELLMDVERVKYYEAQGRYPSYGESCNDFFTPCEFFNTCSMSTKMLELPYNEETMKDKEYLLNLSLLDLIDAQLNREEIK